MNLLSVGAAYGILTFVFQEGHGAKLLGLDGPSPIVSYVPLLMFAILFGLSMDYQVFLLTRVQEHYRRTKDNHEAVVDGLAVSARVITSAALIMVCVYTSFILSGDPTVKQFGLGLAAAIAVDATIVRCLIVPAVMVLLGRANWWLPGWAERLLPRVGIEGEEFFKAKDAAAATGSARRPALGPHDNHLGNQLGQWAGGNPCHADPAGFDDDPPAVAAKPHVDLDGNRAVAAQHQVGEGGQQRPAGDPQPRGAVAGDRARRGPAARSHLVGRRRAGPHELEAPNRERAGTEVAEADVDFVEPVEPVQGVGLFLERKVEPRAIHRDPVAVTEQEPCRREGGDRGRGGAAPVGQPILGPLLRQGRDHELAHPGEGDEHQRRDSKPAGHRPKVGRWREGVWRNAERLLNARSDAERRRVALQIEANAAAWARLMSAPEEPGYRAQRDAYCRAQLAD